MASTFNRSPVDVIRRKPLLRNKQPNEGSLKPGTRKILMSLSQMSPEAQRAMTMTHEDAKENISNNENINPGNKSFHDHGQGRDVSNISAERDVPILDTDRASRSSSRLLARLPGAHLRGYPRTRRNTTSSFGTSIQTGTSRSRSTLSVTERNNSISDNMDNCDNQNNTDKINATSRRNSLRNKDNDSGSDPAKSQNIEALVLNSTTESNNNNISEENNNTQLDTEDHARRPESFVLALDRALEDSCISRLSGDITNTAGISELGKVRALDGGRLTNAQEVVVNVCYDDDRELVFHDNDEENVNNAKATSNIRINLWIEYNKGFQPEDISDDAEVIATNDNEDKTCQTSEAAPCNDPTSSLPKRKDRHGNNPSSDRPQAASKHTSKSKLPVTKTDLNNNKTTSKLKTHNFKTARSNSSSRNGSTNISDGVKKRDMSSFKTEIKK